MSESSIYVKLTNRWAHFVGWYPEELSDFFSYRKPGYFHAPQYKSHAWDGRNRMIRYRRLPAGLFLAFRKEAEQAVGVSFEIESQRTWPKFQDIEFDSDRKYQNESVDAMVKHSRCGGILLSATGTGKTYVAAKFFEKLLGYGIFIVDELTLLEQTREELSKVMGEKVGIVGKSLFLPRRITVATIQTLHLHRQDRIFKQWQKKLTIGIIDELHKALNKRNLNVLGALPVKAMFGLTATLQLGKRPVLMRAYALCGPVIYTYPLEQGTDEGFLAPGCVVGIDIPRDDKYKERELTHIDAYEQVIVKSREWNRPLRRLTLESVRRGYSTIVLVHRKKHIRKTTEYLAQRGCKVRCVFGDKSTEDRRKYIRLLEKKKIDVIVASAVFEKGINIKRVNVIIDGTCQKDPNAALQKYGRGVRKHDAKQGLLYFHLAIKPRVGSRFRKAGAVHRRAFRQAGVTVKPMWWSNASSAFDMAEATLKKVLKDLKRKTE